MVTKKQSIYTKHKSNHITFLSDFGVKQILVREVFIFFHVALKDHAARTPVSSNV